MTTRRQIWPHERLFDRLNERWESGATRRAVAWTLVAAFFLSIGVIELARLGVLSEVLGHPVPTNHLAAISWTFTLLLIAEVLDLIFSLARSVASALGKQLEIFSLILARKTFDELALLPEPISLKGELEVVQHMGALAGGALVVFGLLVLYDRIQQHRPISDDPLDVERFVALKKGVCLGLLAAFIATGAVFGVSSLTVEDAASPLSLDFFIVFYTVLVFADVLLVLGSLTVSREYRIVFRNTTFAVVTVFLRLALTADPYPKAIIGALTALLALIAAFLYEKSWPTAPDGSSGLGFGRRKD